MFELLIEMCYFTNFYALNIDVSVMILQLGILTWKLIKFTLSLINADKTYNEMKFNNRLSNIVTLNYDLILSHSYEAG